MPSESKRLFIAIPTYNYTVNAGILTALSDGFTRADRYKYTVSIAPTANSCLENTFNYLLCRALDVDDAEGLDYFLMIHADVVPRCRPDDVTGWVDVMVGELEAGDFDVLSAIVPIKDARGLTSTAVDTDRWRPRRLTMMECRIYGILDSDGAEKRFGAPLLVNTGLMLWRFGDWCRNVCFQMESRITRTDKGWCQDCEPEDWHFSRQARRLGLRIGATRRIAVRHYGEAAFDSDNVWGQEIDTQNT